MMRLAIIFVFILVSLFGANVLMNQMDDEMMGCPFMGDSLSLCQMGFLEHINLWQSIFIINLISFTLLLLAPFLLANNQNLVPNFCVNRHKKEKSFFISTKEVLRI